MKQVKIFSESSHSDLERELNGYLNTLDHSNILRNITYNFPTETSKLWTAVVEVDLYGGKPVFWAANKKELAEAVKMYGDKAEAPFVVRIPDGVSEIEGRAFEEDESVGVILIPHTVTKIGSYAFMRCSNLQDVVIPESVKEIEYGAFWECPKIRNVYIPKSVTKIDYSITSRAETIKVDPENPVYDSRNDCNAIIETKTNTLIQGCYGTIIPNSVTYIRIYAFNCCYNLHDVHIKINDPNSVRFGDDDDCFCDCWEDDKIPRRLYVPKGKMGLYKKHPAFKEFDIIIEE